jgi:hypothetical protein
LTQITPELPLADSLANDLTGRCVLSGLDRRLEGRELLACQRNADFLNVGHGHSGSLGKIYYLVGTLSTISAQSACGNELWPRN